MPIKKNPFAAIDPEWASLQLESWKAYIDTNPFNDMKDRIEWKPTSKGNMLPMVIASKEAQMKSCRETLRDYIALAIELKKLLLMTAAEEKEIRGGEDMPDIMS